jgi:hypothetical protein
MLFYYLIDKAIIFSTANPPKLIRISIAIVLGLFNSFLIDSFYFEDDIAAARNAEIKDKELHIRADFALMDSLLSSEKQNFLRLVSAEYSKLSAKRAELNVEADGSGGSRERGKGSVYNIKYKNYQVDSIEVAKKVAAYEKQMSNIDTQLAANNSLMNSQISDLEKETSFGINKNIQILHQVVFFEGNATNILMAIIILLISFILEIAPLLCKSLYDTSEYFDIVAIYREIKKNEFSIKKEKERNLVSVRLLYEQDEQEYQLLMDHFINKLIKDVEYNMRIIEISMKRFIIEEKEKELSNNHPLAFEVYIRPVLEKAYKNIHDAVMDTISKTVTK